MASVTAKPRVPATTLLPGKPVEPNHQGCAKLISSSEQARVTLLPQSHRSVFGWRGAKSMGLVRESPPTPVIQGTA
jgi:hypothetical protein